MAENNLIHAGLPWTNPAKITIKSSEFINDVTINRGILNLLNNDYYLDLKTEAINEYLETIVQDHINDNDIHFSWDDVLDLFNRISCLSSNAGYRIPIRKPRTGGTITSAEITSIINSVPRNLNGYVLVLEICVPLSAVPSAERSSCKTSWNGTGNSPSGTYNYNFGHKSLNIEDFFGGTLIIWANNEYFIDDVSNPAIFDSEMPATELNETITQLQKRLLSPSSSVVENNLITLSGDAINARYAVMSLRNNDCDTHVYNMHINNTLSSTNNISEIISDMEFPEVNDVICMWPLEQDYKSIYRNESMLNSNTMTLIPVMNSSRPNDQKTLFETIDSLSCAGFNIDLTLKTDGDQPDYLMFDTSYGEAERPNSNILRNIIYNTSNNDPASVGTTPNTTMLFWAKLDNINTHSPILVDTVPGNDRKNGFYIYLDQMLRYDPAVPDLVPYYSGQREYYAGLTGISSGYIGKWAMFVIEFQHKNANTKNVEDRAPYNNSLYQKIDNDGEMRVNMTAYWRSDKEDPTGFNPTTNLLLYPNKATYENSENENDFVSIGYQFKKPDYEYSNPVRLFANQIKNTGDTQTVFNYDFFEGYVRNIIMFNRFLTTKEIYSIFADGPGATAYDWYETGEYDIISELGPNNYFGSIYAHNVKHLTLTNSVITQKLQ